MIKKLILLTVSVAAVIILLLNVFHSIGAEKPLYTNITLSEYQKKISDLENFSIYIYATSCRACQTFKPIVNEVLKNKPNVVYALNLDKNQNRDLSFLKEQNISLTPTMVNYEKGKEIAKKEGVLSETELKNFLNLN
ncbi:MULTISPECIES: thioredoxin family protein [Paenibacillus]|uniref:thioredoxin family protein n=1 Tax=Paenibacillus TaxID=44249 RepID=UPI0009FB8A34|nr:thioredoxin family protein [Paenibacillus sp. FSL H8-0259]